MVIQYVRRLGVLAGIAGIIVTAALSLNRVYNGHLLVELVAGAAGGSVLLPLLLRKAPAAVVAPLSLAALGGYGLYCVHVSAAAGAISGDLFALTVDAARNAIPRLLTALIPVEPQPDTVLAPVVLAWLVGLAGAELAIRANRPAVGCVPPVLLYAGALILVGPNAQVLIWQPVTVAALVAIALAVGRTGRVVPVRQTSRTPSGGITAQERATLRLRTAAGLAGAVVIVLAVVAGVAPLVVHRVGHTPSDPRILVQPPDLDTIDQNPLIRISGWMTDPTQHLFDVRVIRGAPPLPPSPSPSPTADASGAEGVPEPAASPDDPAAAADDAAHDAAHDTRLRLAVLEDWDGITWHASADYRGAGRVLPPLDVPANWIGHPDAPPLDIEESITVDHLEGRLLPAVPMPQRIDGVRVSYDRASGTLIQDAPLSPGLSYTVTSSNPAVDANLLPAADVPSGPAVAHLLAVGDSVPQDLSHLAEVIGQGQGSPYNRAAALQSFLAEHYRYVADAPSGHAYPNLRFFLFSPAVQGGRRGTSEQFATAFATLGRLMGLPTRVVVGFHTPAGGGPVTAADALAWPEVLFTDVGWVAFDPLPPANSQPVPLEDQFLPQPPPPTSPPQSVPPQTSTYSAGPPSTVPSGPALDGGVATGVIVGGVGGGLLLLALGAALATVLLRALLRRRRLDQGSPPQRIIGAWNEVLDALLLAGKPPPDHLAATGVAAHAAAVVESEPGRRHSSRPRPAAPPLDDLADRVNTVGFGASPDATDDLAAHSARVAAVSFTRAVRARRSWWRRLLWTVDPRPLRRRRS